MFSPIRISPSILSADFMHLADEIADVEAAGADWLHIDVMDGHFVPNLTVGVPVEAQLARIAHVPLDLHLMIDNPLVQLPWYLAHKPSFTTIHYEALGNDSERADDEARRAIRMIHDAGSKAGIALKPDTSINVLQTTIAEWDMVLVMSVFPGFSGQSYIPKSADRVARVAALARQAGVSPLIQVDGGIGAETAPFVAAWGADVLVAGNGVFKASDRARAIAGIRAAATRAQQKSVARADGHTERAAWAKETDCE